MAVVGGHGKTGRAVTAALQRRGAQARALGRAELRTPMDAFRDCDVAYLIAPNMHADEPAFIGGLLDSVAKAEVGKVVFHSVAIPYAPSMPHHLGKAVAEDLVRRLPIAWTILQPGPYLQNFLPALRARPPRLDQPYDVTKPFNFVDLADVAEAAATVALEPGHDGATYELGGPDRASVADVARIAGDLLGTEVPSGRVDPAHWAASQGAGLEPRVRDWLLAMFDYYDHFGLRLGSVSLGAVLERRPTGIRAALQRDL